MSTPPRVPGRHGWLPRDPHRPVPMLEHYLRPWDGAIGAQPLPAASGDVDRVSEVPEWDMYVNGPSPSNPPYAPDGLGDCTIAGIAHSFSAMAVYAGQPEPHFTAEAIVGAYSACGGYVPGDPSTDQGCDMATVLAYMQHTGMPDDTGKVHKVAAWAAFADPRNERLLAQVLAATGTVYLGSGIQQSQEQQFASGQPWQWIPGESLAGGHCYVLQRRSVGGVGILKMVTWGAVQAATRQYWWNAVGVGGGEAYYVASQDYVSAHGATIEGLDLQQLCADSADVQ